MDRTRVNVRSSYIGDRRQLQVVITLLHPAAAVWSESAVTTVRDAVIRNRCPTRSARRRPPDALVDWRRVSIVVGLYIDDPHIHLVAPWHHRELAAIDQATGCVRTRRAQPGCKTRARLRCQPREMLAIGRGVQPVTPDKSVESPARSLVPVVNHRRSRGSNRTVRKTDAVPRQSPILRVVKSACCGIPIFFQAEVQAVVASCRRYHHVGIRRAECNLAESDA